MKTESTHRFGGFFIGSVMAGFLVAYGLELFVATVEEPITAAVIAVLNFVIRAVQPGIVPLRLPSLTWLLFAYTGVLSATALAVGLVLGAWLGGSSTRRNSSS